MAKFKYHLAAALVLLLVGYNCYATKKPESKAVAKIESFVDECRKIYERTCPNSSCPCMCRDDEDSAGRICGDRSAEAIEGGANPTCHENDSRVVGKANVRAILLINCTYSRP